ncbi:hypothetical protein DFH27DRAFT_65501 [Peziza echinospora]|nr:hypothetical protein DFH27DRAFT_65501 [Peziza echinospora]
MPAKKGARKRTNATPVPASSPPPQPQQQQEPEQQKIYTGGDDDWEQARPARSTRAASRERQMRSSAGTANTAVVRRQQLSNVEEEVDEFEEENRYWEGEGELSRPLNEISSDDESIGERSLRESTSGTQVEAQSIDKDQAVLQLPRLFENSQEAFKFLSSFSRNNLLQNLRKPGSQEGPLLDRIYREFMNTKSYFGNYEYVDLRIIAIVQDTDLFIPLISLANYAALGLGLLSLTGLTSACKEYLTNLEMTFPECFPPQDQNMKTKQRMFDLLLDIRTQLFIAMAHVEDYEVESGDELLRQAFLEQSPYGGSDDGEVEWDEEWMQNCRPKDWDSLNENQQQSLLDRTAELRQAYTSIRGGVETVGEIDFNALTSNWPWEAFVTDMLNFIKSTARKMMKSEDMKTAYRIASDASKAASEAAARNATVPQQMQQQQAEAEAQVQHAPQQQQPAEERRRSARRSTSERLSSKSALGFLKKRKSELQLAPNKQATAATAVAIPTTTTTKATPPPPLVYKLPPQPPREKIATSSAGIKALKIVKQRRAVSNPGTSVLAQPQATTAATTQANKPKRIQSSSAVEQDLERYKRIQANKNKENQLVPTQPSTAATSGPSNENVQRAVVKYGFNEKHPNARKPRAFDMEELLVETQMAEGSGTYQQPSPRGQKRGRVVEEEDEFQQLDLEEDAAPVNTAPTRPSPKKRRTIPQVQHAQANPSTPRRPTQRNAARPITRVPPPQPSPSPARPRREDHDDNQAIVDSIHGGQVVQHNAPARNYAERRERIKQEAQINRQQAIPKPSTAGHRRPWTPAEELELIKQVQIHGCAWALIERKGTLHRNQAQLKDKARNLKFLCLKNRIPLPSEFRFVTISTRFVEELQRMDINHEDARYYTAEAEGLDDESQDGEGIEDDMELYA